MSAHPDLAALVLIAVVLGIVACVLAGLAFSDVRKLRRLPNRRPVGELRADDERQLNLGAPRATGERRGVDLGPSARHRHPEDARSTRSGAHRLREGLDDEPGKGPSTPSGASSANVEPTTVEHAPPTADMRRLPPPGSIAR